MRAIERKKHPPCRQRRFGCRHEDWTGAHPAGPALWAVNFTLSSGTGWARAWNRICCN